MSTHNINALHQSSPLRAPAAGTCFRSVIVSRVITDCLSWHLVMTRLRVQINGLRRATEKHSRPTRASKKACMIDILKRIHELSATTRDGTPVLQFISCGIVIAFHIPSIKSGTSTHQTMVFFLFTGISIMTSGQTGCSIDHEFTDTTHDEINPHKAEYHKRTEWTRGNIIVRVADPFVNHDPRLIHCSTKQQ